MSAGGSDVRGVSYPFLAAAAAPPLVFWLAAAGPFWSPSKKSSLSVIPWKKGTSHNVINNLMKNKVYVGFK